MSKSDKGGRPPPEHERGKLLKIELPFEDAVRAALEVERATKGKGPKRKGRTS